MLSTIDSPDLPPSSTGATAWSASHIIEDSAIPFSPPNALWVRRLRSFTIISAAFVATVGAGHLLAWASGYMAERAFSAITMKTNAALALLAAGLALLLAAPVETGAVRLRVARSLAFLTFLIGAATVFENLTGWNLHIDELLATEPRGALATSSANRMGFPGSTSLLLAGMALLFLFHGKAGTTRVAQRLALFVCLIATFSSISYLYGAQSFYAIARFTGIAWPTAATLLALGLAILFARPTEGFVAQLTVDDPGGVALRRWPPVLLIPVALGWLRLAAERNEFVDAATGTALTMLFVIVALFFVAYRSAVAVSRSSTVIVDREERLRLSQEAAGIGVLDWDVQRDINRWTPQMAAIHGLPPASFPQTRDEWLALVHPADRTAMAESIDKSLLTGKSVESEWRVIWPDGSIHWISCRWRAFDDRAGRPVRMLGVSIDVTGRKLMQETLEGTIQKLEDSNRELEQFAYICAHDLQEPMRQIQLFVQLLQRHFDGSANQTALDYLEHVYSAARRMSDLIAAILEYSRASTADKPGELLDSEEILDAALANLAAVIEDSGARVTHGKLPKVFGHRTQLMQLFQNLIGNAIKFRRQGISPRVHVDCRPASHAWLFSVRDNGIGIEDRYREKLFRIFQRLHSRQEYPGTGIGLAICKKVVEAHRGSIWLEPSDGQGSTFTFMLPDEKSGGQDTENLLTKAQAT